jgi:hypothetical protein
VEVAWFEEAASVGMLSLAACSAVSTFGEDEATMVAVIRAGPLRDAGHVDVFAAVGHDGFAALRAVLGVGEGAADMEEPPAFSEPVIPAMVAFFAVVVALVHGSLQKQRAAGAAQWRSQRIFSTAVADE